MNGKSRTTCQIENGTAQLSPKRLRVDEYIQDIMKETQMPGKNSKAVANVVGFSGVLQVEADSVTCEKRKNFQNGLFQQEVNDIQKDMEGIPIIVGVQDHVYDLWQGDEEDFHRQPNMGSVEDDGIECVYEGKMAGVKKWGFASADMWLDVTVKGFMDAENSSTVTEPDSDKSKADIAKTDGELKRLLSSGSSILPSLEHTSILERLLQEQNLSRKMKLPINVPDVSKCVSSWRKLFPWMQYHRARGEFVCQSCCWDLKDASLSLVFVVTCEADVKEVAANLRRHSLQPYHEFSVKNYNVVLSHLKFLYTQLKEFPNDNISVSILKQNLWAMFPSHCEMYEDVGSSNNEYIMNLIKMIGTYLQLNVLERLRECQWFSAVSVGQLGLAVVRWNNPTTNLPEEHILLPDGEEKRIINNVEQPLGQYLKKCGVDMSRMVSYTQFQTSRKAPNTVLGKIVPLVSPVRCVPFTSCLNAVMNCSPTISVMLKVAAALCKMYHAKPHMFASIPEAKLTFQDLAEPYLEHCAKSEKVLEFVCSFIKPLEAVVVQVANNNSDLEAYGVLSLMYYIRSRLELVLGISEETGPIYLKNILLLLPKVYQASAESTLLEASDFKRVQANLQLAQRSILFLMQHLHCRQHVSVLANACKEEGCVNRARREHVVMCILNIYLSYVEVGYRCSIETGIPNDLQPLESADRIIRDKETLTKGLESLKSKLAVCQLADGKKVMQQLEDFVLRDSQRYSQLGFLELLREMALKRNEAANSACHYDDAHHLMNVVSVMPFLPANVERCMFDIVISSALLTLRGFRGIVSPVIYIWLEGPPSDEIKWDEVMEMMRKAKS